jgi:hypothetical protein
MMMGSCPGRKLSVSSVGGFSGDSYSPLNRRPGLLDPDGPMAGLRHQGLSRMWFCALTSCTKIILDRWP